MDSGEIVEVEERDNGYILWFGEPEFAELGVAVYHEDLKHLPRVGDEIVVEGLDNPFGITYLCLNNEVQFRRTDQEATLYREIRRHENRIIHLRKELENVKAD